MAAWFLRHCRTAQIQATFQLDNAHFQVYNKEACQNAGENTAYHFADVSKVIEAGKGAKNRQTKKMIHYYRESQNSGDFST